MMDRSTSPDVRPRRPFPWGLGLVAVGLAFAWVLGGTMPFTTSANVLTALPIVGVAVAAVVLAVRRTPDRASTSLTDPSSGGPARGWWVWVLVFGLLVTWELVMLFGMPRSSHPTLSSLEVSITRWHATKALVAAAWLALGAFLVTR